MKNLSEGQDNNAWNNWWSDSDAISAIRNWDFYGGRQFISKYIPRFGKVLEAGCGTGRYVFYFRRLGIDIEGIDFSQTVIEKANNSKEIIDNEAKFTLGDITKLPFQDNSLAGYISLGVLEHFYEGPQKALAEAFRVLRPGGIAIITTPNISFSVFYNKKIKGSFKNLVRFILRFPEPPFFQYEYTPGKLKKLIKGQGFYISRSEGCDILYSIGELIKFSNIREKSFHYNIARKFENSILKNLGAQSVVIAIKKAPKMYCFLSGKLEADDSSLRLFDVPISEKYHESNIASLYKKNKKVKYAEPYKIDPEIVPVQALKCAKTGKTYMTDPVFETFGFNSHVNPEILKDPLINMELSCNNISPIWRNL